MNRTRLSTTTRGPAGRCSGLTARAGFTLVEIMLAIAILMMVLSAVYSSWSAILRGTRSGMQAAVEAQQSRIAMRTLTDALMSAQLFAASPNFYTFEADNSSDFATLSLVSHLPSSFVGSGLFGDLAVRRITFTVEAGRDSGNQLVMYQQPLLVEANVNEQLGPTVLAKDVSEFTLEFWDERTKDWSLEWLYTNQLPKLVQVTLGYRGGRGAGGQPAEVETRMVALPAMVVSRDSQLPPRAAPGPVPGPGPLPPLGGGALPGTVNPPAGGIVLPGNR